MSEELLFWLQQQSPQDVKRWILDIESQGNGVTTDINWWISLAQWTAHNAYLRPQVTREDQIMWAEIAIRVYDYIATHLHAPTPHMAQLSAMALRSVMINLLGPQEHHFVLDPRRIEQWFFDTSLMTIEEAYTIAHNLSQSPSARKRELYQILHRLIALETLVEKGLIYRVHEVRQWQDVSNLISNTTDD
ncbi:MAG: hypothetical protein HC828_15120 [Blastochloris sp.]|nr:hypothetical protein [Blastochloris sp.]